MKRSTLKRAALVVVLAVAAVGAGVKVAGPTHAGSAKAPVVQTQRAYHTVNGIPMLDN